MKQSGIEWIGEIPEDWEVRKIKTLFDLRSEKNYKPLEDVNLISLYTDKGVMQHDDIEQTTGNRAQNADGYKLVYKNDIIVNIILCWMGAIGRSDYDGVTSPAYDVYKPHNDIDCNFFHYYFRTTGFNGDCYRYGRGIMAMRWRTYSDQFRAIKVLLPPQTIQQKIATYLDKKCAAIDSAVEKEQLLIEELKNYKQSVITQTVTKGIRPNRKMKQSGIEWIGEIPEEWEIGKIKHIADIYGRIGFRGYTDADLVSEGEGPITLSPSNMKDTGMNYQKCSYLTWNKYDPRTLSS